MNRRSYDRDLKPAFEEFISRNSRTEHAACLKNFLTELLRENADNIASVVLFGGLVRDGKPISGWSDIDMLVVFRRILDRDARSLAQLVDRMEAKYNVRIDLTQVDEETLSDPLLLGKCFNSELLNALAMRPNVSAVLYGALPQVSVSPEQEKMAAFFYVDQTLSSFRRYLTEQVYRHDGEEHFRRSVVRITRWLFSIIRASLRLFDIYVHPYEPSLAQVEGLFPQIDLTVPYALLAMRNEPTRISTDFALFSSVEHFLQEYVTFVLLQVAKNESSQQIQCTVLPYGAARTTAVRSFHAGLADCPHEAGELPELSPNKGD